MRLAARRLAVAVAALLAAALWAPAGAAAEDDDAPLPRLLQSPCTRLRADADGRFKILQVSDLEYSNGASQACQHVSPWRKGSCDETRTVGFLRRLIAAEQPQLVVVTGDTIVAGARDPRAALTEVLQPLVDAQVPWALVLGNHDTDRTGLSAADLLQHVRRLDPAHGCTAEGPAHLPGLGNYNLTVRDAAGAAPLLNVVLLDSGRFGNEFGGYDWITHRQIQWTLDTAAAVDREAAAPRRVPVLLFFHMPIPEFGTLPEDPDMEARLNGAYQERVWASRVNGGLYAAAVLDGHIKGIFVGHDHLNDFCARAKHGGPYLCYAGSAGYGAYSRIDFDRRARVILLEADGSLHTWKRVDDGALSIVDPERLLTEPVSGVDDPRRQGYRYWALPFAGWMVLAAAGGSGVTLLALLGLRRTPKRLVRALTLHWAREPGLAGLARTRNDKLV